MFAKINSRNMEASISKDLDKVKVFVKENLGGFDKVDQAAPSGLRRWVGETALGYYEAFSTGGTEAHAQFLVLSSYMFRWIGMYKQACMCAQKSRKIFEKYNNKWGIEDKMTSEGLALVMWQKYTEALSLQKNLLNMAIENFGMSHPNTVNCQYNLGKCYMKMKRWDEAEVVITAVLKSLQKLDGPMSRDIRGSMSMLGEVLRDSGKNTERAERLFKQLHDYNSMAFEPEHVTALMYLNDYARCLALKGDLGKAPELYKKAIPVLLKTYGLNYDLVQNLLMWIVEAEQKMPVRKE